jgi:transposase
MMAQLVGSYLVGIDVSKDKLDVHEWWSARHYTISNTAAAIAEWLSGYSVSSKIALEPTNRYHQCVAERADQGPGVRT